MRTLARFPAAIAAIPLLLAGAAAQDAPAGTAEVDAAVKKLIDEAATNFEAVKGDSTQDEDTTRPAFASKASIPGWPAVVIRPATDKGQSAEALVRFDEADESAAFRRFEELEALIKRCVPAEWLADKHAESRSTKTMPKHFAAREDPGKARRVAASVLIKDGKYTVVLAIQGNRPPKKSGGDGDKGDKAEGGGGQ